MPSPTMLTAAQFIRLVGLPDAPTSGISWTDPALQRLAMIARGADTGRPDLTAQMLRHRMVVYDALYTSCQAQTGKAA